MTGPSDLSTAKQPTFRVAPWYSAVTAPSRLLCAPIWLQAYRRLLGMRALKQLSVHTWKTTSTVFVLGSGPSINELSDSQWAVIQEHTSIGFNWWLFHEYVPDLYVFENFSPTQRDLLAERAYEYKKTPLVLKHAVSNFSPMKHRRRIRELALIPLSIRRNIHLSSDTIIPGRTHAELRSAIRFMDRTGIFNTKDQFQWLPKRTASLTFIVALCVRAGFQHIVLCGVDLNRSGYFFSGNSKLMRRYSQAAPSHSHVPSSGLHATEDGREKVLPISDILQVMYESILIPRGITLSVAHGDSRLATTMPVYNWSS